MPIVNALNTVTIRDVNIGLALTLFPRFSKTYFGKLCGTPKPSTALVEPFAFDGAAPLLKKFNGNMDSTLVNTFSLQVPNPIYKNYEEIARTQYEADQTGTVRKRASAIGLRIAQGPDYALARTILKGDSETTVVFEGTTYNTTFDGVAQFSATHSLGQFSGQSNIVTGNLPATVALLDAQDIATTVQQLFRDYAIIIDRIASFTDDKGAQLFTDFDPETQLQLIGPPCLRPAFDLAFTVGNSVGGSGGTSGSSGTTKWSKKLVAEIITPGLLKGCIDIDADPQTTVTPTYPTQYYWAIKDDFVRPWYFQRFRPKKDSEMVGSFDPEASADSALAMARRVYGEDSPNASPLAADLYAMTSIDTNVGAIGANAQPSVATQEKFFMSGRTRFRIFCGPWFLCGKVDPSGQSA